MADVRKSALRFLPFWRNRLRQAPQDLEADPTDRLERLLSEIGKLGREQFRTTTLIESQAATLDELADAWRQVLRRQEREAADLRQELTDVEERVSLRMASGVLPVADALDSSVRVARELLAELRANPPSTRVSWLARLAGARTERSAADRNWTAALESWFQGLLLIERRLLAFLEREGVRPMVALGQPFDPHRHVAVAVKDERGVPTATVVGEEVRGFMFGDRVLRHAEVVVARDPSHETGMALASEH